MSKNPLHWNPGEIQWPRIRADYQRGMPVALCVKRENRRLEEEGNPKRVRAQVVSTRALQFRWKRIW